MPFNVGDVVRLKGHPTHRMTVVEIRDDWVMCRWVDNSGPQEGVFSIDDIEYIPETSQ